MPGCSYKVKDIPCFTSRETRKLFRWDGLDPACVFTHADCVCNEEIALSQRHQVDDGSTFDKSFYPLLKSEILKLRKHCQPITREAIIKGYSGRKKRLAEEANESLKVDKLNLLEDAKVKMFLKDDKYHDLSDIKAPRCIQYRSKRYALTLAQYTYPIEHKVYNHKDEDGLKCFAKGRNLEERAADLKEIWDSYDSPYALLLDHSKFDAHFCLHHHKAARALNCACFEESGHSGFLRQLLKAQIKNRGSTKNGTKYVTKGTRMSGDQNTGLDNSTVNWAMIRSVLKLCGIKGSVYVDGDDSVVVIESRDLPKFKLDWFSKFGMKTKLETSDHFEGIEFCQTRPVWNGEKWIMCRNPERVLSRIQWVVKKFPTEMDANYIKNLMLAESALHEGLPVMGPIAARLSSEIVVKKFKLLEVEADNYVKMLGKQKGRRYDRPVTHASRLSYAAAWGMNDETQRKYESMGILSPEDPMPQYLAELNPVLVV